MIKSYDELNKKPIISISESSKDFQVPRKTDKSYVVSRKEYKDIMTMYMKKLAYYLITTGEAMVLPNKLGEIKIYKYNFVKLQKNLAEKNIKVRKLVNFKSTKELKKMGINKTVLVDNKSTYGYWFKVKWSKFREANFKNKNCYSFNLLRTVKRNNYGDKNKGSFNLVNFFKEKGWMLYSELPSYSKVKLK